MPKFLSLTPLELFMNKLVPPVFCRRHFSSPEGTSVGVCSSLYFCFGRCNTGDSLASTTRKLIRAMEGERRNSWARKGYVFCRLLSPERERERERERVHCYKLRWEANLVQLHWGLNRFFSGLQPNHICSIFTGKCLSHSQLPSKWTFLVRSTHSLVH